MASGPAFLVWHSIDPDDDLTKLLGVYSTYERAERRVAQALSVAGFVDFQEGFLIDEYPIDKDMWTEGFELITPEGWVAPEAGPERSSKPYGEQRA